MSMATNPETGFRLTGRHVLAMLIAFFGVVFAVNFAMMHFATSTFSGLEQASPYQDGLQYNLQIEAARRQDARGWRVDAKVTRSPEGQVLIAVDAVDARGERLAGLAGSVTLERPADRRLDRAGTLDVVGAGRYRAAIGDVGRGQWDVVVEFAEAGERRFLSRNRIILD